MTHASANARIVYIIRHAESRYNVAFNSWNVRGMVNERDHGLSELGVKQCQDLRAKIEQAKEDGDADGIAIATRTNTLSSPLCRAIVTGHLALPSVAGPAVVLSEGAERCMVRFFARDSVGSRRSDIGAKVSDELRLLGAVEPPPEIDVSSVTQEKWYIIGESAGSVMERARSLLRNLYARAADPGALVFVGHSQMLRHLFQESCSAHFASTDIGSNLQQRLLQNCAVLRLTLAFENADQETPCIVDAAFLFGTGLKD